MIARDRLPVSVIMPCWNAENTILIAVQSIASQTRLPEEVILVDDASTDTTAAVVERLPDLFPQLDFKIVHLDSNVGPGPARNIAWDLATSPYLAFLDADDVWHHRKLERQLPIIIQDPSMIVLGALSGPAVGTVDHCQPLETKAPVVRSFSIKQMLFSNRLPTRTAVITRDCTLRFGGKDDAEDFLLWAQISSCFGKVHRLEEVLAFPLAPDPVRPSLTRHLARHEKRELTSLKRLRCSGQIGPTTYLLATVWSLAKYARRVLLRAVGG